MSAQTDNYCAGGTLYLKKRPPEMAVVLKTHYNTGCMMIGTPDAHFYIKYKFLNTFI